MKDKGSEKEQITHATIGSGNIEIADGSGEGINRDVNKAEEITKDITTGALNGSFTIDDEWLSGEGRDKILKNGVNIISNLRIIYEKNIEKLDSFVDDLFSLDKKLENVSEKELGDDDKKKLSDIKNAIKTLKEISEKGSRNYSEEDLAKIIYIYSNIDIDSIYDLVEDKAQKESKEILNNQSVQDSMMSCFKTNNCEAVFNNTFKLLNSVRDVDINYVLKSLPNKSNGISMGLHKGDDIYINKDYISDKTSYMFGVVGHETFHEDHEHLKNPKISTISDDQFDFFKLSRKVYISSEYGYNNYKSQPAEISADRVKNIYRVNYDNKLKELQSRDKSNVK